MMRHDRVRITVSPLVLLLVGFLLGLAGGCGRDEGVLDEPTSPASMVDADLAPPPREFYPLAVGNSWTCDRKYTIEIEVVLGPPFHREETYEGDVDYRITGPEEIESIEYLVEQATLTFPERPDVVTWWTRLRQDHAGLYAADVPTTDPPGPAPPGPVTLSAHAERVHPMEATGKTLESPANPEEEASQAADEVPVTLRAWRGLVREPMPPMVERAWRDHARRHEMLRRLLEPGFEATPRILERPGGPLPGESLLLAYPLHPKATWFKREEPFVVRSTVETHEWIDLPAGRFPSYRVRVDSEFLDPEDRVLVWYGPCGRLALSIHTETLALDTETGEVARITTDETEKLSDLAIAEPRRCGRSSTGEGR